MKIGIKDLTKNSVNYNKWVNEKYSDWLSKKPNELLHKEFPSSFSSIAKTLNHIWASQENWWQIISKSQDYVDRNNVKILNTDEIFKGIIANSIKLTEYIESLTEEQLSEKIKLEAPIFKCDMPKYEYIQHIINHGTYHRGQIVTMGRNIGITDAPMTDYNIFMGRF